MDEEIRELLQRKADELSPPHGEMPVRLRRRARARVALAMTTAVVVAAALGAAGYAGIAQLSSGPVHEVPGGHTPSRISQLPPTPDRSSQPLPGILRACAADDVKGVEQLQGAAGSLEGTLAISLTWDTTCTLRGRAVIQIVTQGGRPLAVQIVPTEPSWKVNGAAAPANWPLVVLRREQPALVRLRWSNYCGRVRSNLRWRVVLPLPAGSSVWFGVKGLPPCNGPGQPSTLEVGPFEPQ